MSYWLIWKLPIFPDEHKKVFFPEEGKFFLEKKWLPHNDFPTNQVEIKVHGGESTILLEGME